MHSPYSGTVPRLWCHNSRRPQPHPPAQLWLQKHWADADLWRASQGRLRLPLRTVFCCLHDLIWVHILDSNSSNILRWTSLRYMDVYLQGLGNRLESPFTPGDKRALPRRHSKCGFSSSIIISDGGVCSSCMPLRSIEVAVVFIMGRHFLQNIMSWCI